MDANFNIVNTSMIVVGAVLIYCGIKNITPKQALQQIIAGSKANAPVGATVSKPSGNAVPKSGTSGGGGSIKPAQDH